RHIGLMAVVYLALFGCGGKSKEPPPAEVETPVQVAKATRSPIQRIVNAEAILFPVDQASVTPKISAPVSRFLVKRGDHVRKGQLLAVLENRDLAASVQENKGLYNQAEAAYRTTTAATLPDDLIKARTDVQSARQALDAAQKLYENRQSLVKEGALAQKLADDAKVAMVQAQSAFATAEKHLESLQNVGRLEQVKGAQGQLDAAKARYQAAQAQLSYTEIQSPIGGIVADRPLYPGEMAASGNPIISIIDVSQVIARANVPVKDAAALRVGKPASIVSPLGELPGKVTVVSPAVDPSTTTVEVWVQAANPGERLKPGITVHVSILAETVPDAIVVPASALLSSDEGGDKVMVVTPDSTAHEHKVEVGIRDGDKVQIASGIKEGDQVIIAGGLGLDDKAKVIVDSGAEKAGGK
ncbi:MAG: efflux RND transporter periplasmic adaptor subunit, partial [Acidobacteriota bacterium]|nr:efflux RND transporter periplasmic adaptor subunit [Acidobacteriota bacterium]